MQCVRHLTNAELVPHRCARLLRFDAPSKRSHVSTAAADAPCLTVRPELARYDRDKMTCSADRLLWRHRHRAGAWSYSRLWPTRRAVCPLGGRGGRNGDIHATDGSSFGDEPRRRLGSEKSRPDRWPSLESHL